MPSVNVKIKHVEKLDNKTMKVIARVMLVRDDGTVEEGTITKNYGLFITKADVLADLEKFIKDEYSSLFAIEKQRADLLNQEISITI